MRSQRRRLIGRLTELMSLRFTPKHTRGVRRIVHATRCTAAYLKHGHGIEGDTLAGTVVKTEEWRTVAIMVACFSRNLWSLFNELMRVLTMC